MNNLKLFFVIFLSMVIFAVAGCGGSSNHSVPQNSGTQEITDEDEELDVGISGDVPAKANDNPDVLRVRDKVLATDENGVPEIFNYAPLPESSDNSDYATGAAINFLKYVSSRDLNENGEFVQTFALEKDNEYIIKYSHSGRNLNGSYLKFRITAPQDQVMILDIIGHVKTSDDEELENQGVISKSIYVPTNHEVIPEESPCIMIYSFKAPLTGDYEFAIRESNPFNLISTNLISADVDETKNYEYPFEFRFYTAGETYSAADDEEKELSARKILQLQRLALNNATEFDENGLPIAFENESSDEYGSDEESTTNNYLDSAYGVLDEVYGASNSNSGKVTIASRIDNIPYDPLFLPGAGFYAHSGLRSIQLTAFYDDVFSENAMDNFTIQRAQGTYMKSRLNLDYVSTEEELQRVKGLDKISDFALVRDALTNKTRDREQLGLAGSKTLVLRYEYYESEPRMPDKGELAIRSAVVKQLKNSFTDFQREHGDYFVAGYTYGMFYEAVVEINAEPYDCTYVTPDFKKVLYDAEAISDYIGKYIKNIFNNLNNNSNLITELENSLDPEKSIIAVPRFYSGEPRRWEDLGWLEKIAYRRVNTENVSVKISYLSHSGTGGKSTVSSVRDLVNDVSDFKNRAAKTSYSNYEKLYATLIRYREIERVKKLIPEELPITAEHYRLIRELNKLIYLTRCYKNALDTIPDSHLINGSSKHVEWNNEFNNVFNLYNNQLNKLCSDINFVREYYNKFNRLLEKYKALNHRYVFYRYFVNYQKSVSNGVGDWKDSDDGWSYPRFRVGFSENDVATNKFVKEDFAYYKRGDRVGPYVKSDWDRAGDEWDLSSTFFDSARAYYYEGGPIKTNYSDGKDLRGHTIGKRSYHWKFERGTLRRIECQVTYSMINMPASSYPFVGLED